MSNSMTRKRKPPGELRKIFAQNLKRMMESRYRESSNHPMALAKDVGMSLSSVQRYLSGENGPTVETIEAFAKVFGLQPFELLVPWGRLGEVRPQPQALERSRTVVPMKRRKVR